MAMNRTPEWIIERATARIAGRIEFTSDIKENKDVVLRHEHPGGDVEELEFRSYAWANSDNTDDSVYKWIARHVDDFLDKIAKFRRKQRETDKSLRPEEKVGPVMPEPKTRKRGRPKGSTKKKPTAPEPESSTSVASASVNT